MNDGLFTGCPYLIHAGMLLCRAGSSPGWALLENTGWEGWGPGLWYFRKIALDLHLSRKVKTRPGYREKRRHVFTFSAYVYVLNFREFVRTPG